jgi:hypothetical protein
MRISARILALTLMMAAAIPAAAEEWAVPESRKPVFGFDVAVGTPSALGDVFRTAFFGVSARYFFTPEIAVSLDYAFMEKEFYYPASASGPWVGPVPWSTLPSRFEDMRDSWIFYHTKHLLAPQLWYIAPFELLELPLAVRVGGGPAISFIVPSEAAEYYPGLSDQFEVFRQDFKAFLGFSVRLGLEVELFEHLRVGADYLFIVDSAAEMAGDVGSFGIDYFDRAGNVVIFAGFRI